MGRVAKRMSANNDTHNGGAGRKHRLTNVGIRGSNISRRYADVTVSPPDEPEVSNSLCFQKSDQKQLTVLIEMVPQFLHLGSF